MKITLIAAMTDQRVIGLNNAMPWHLPEDFKHFKSRTLGKTLIMGSNTYRSIGKPLPGRSTIVLSKRLKDEDLSQEPGIEQLIFNGFYLKTAASIEEAIVKAQAHNPDIDEIMIAGGGKVYEQSLALATHMNLTFIHEDFNGDTYFPCWDEKAWKVTEKTNHQQAKAPYLSYSFVDYQVHKQGTDTIS